MGSVMVARGTRVAGVVSVLLGSVSPNRGLVTSSSARAALSKSEHAMRLDFLVAK